MKKFNNSVLIIGYGAVSKCTLPLLLKHIKIPLENITIIDFEDKSKELTEWTSKGIKFFKEKITKTNLKNILSKYISNGSLLIDLAWNIDCNEMVDWCHKNNVLYINASIEEWNPTKDMENKNPYEKSLYHRHIKLNEMISNWKDKDDCATAVLDHGANPGLISHFAKQAIVDIANKMIEDNDVSQEDKTEISELLNQNNFPELAMKLEIKTIHCSERDTQITNRPKEVNEFVGTWSIEGLREEGTAPAELGWGTHEKELPKLAYIPPVGTGNEIMISQMGINTWVKSWVPDEEIIGMVIRHGEAYGLSDRLTVWKDGKAIYRPTVHYAYMPSHETLSSLHELRCRNYKMQPKKRIMYDEITTGSDILGALVMGHKYKSWWTGSMLNINQSRKLAPGQNATTVQVAIGLISAISWMIDNPKEGICLPDDLPHDYILNISKPYLGKFVSKSIDWTPLKNHVCYFKENTDSKKDSENPWQFKNFLFTP